MFDNLLRKCFICLLLGILILIEGSMSLVMATPYSHNLKNIQGRIRVCVALSTDKNQWSENMAIYAVIADGDFIKKRSQLFPSNDANFLMLYLKKGDNPIILPLNAEELILSKQKMIVIDNNNKQWKITRTWDNCR